MIVFTDSEGVITVRLTIDDVMHEILGNWKNMEKYVLNVIKDRRERL